MKVLYVIESLGAGGTERSLAELLSPLAAAGVEPRVVCLFDRAGAREEVVARGIPVTVLPAGGWARRIAALRRRLSAARPDLVHTMLFRSDLAGRLAAAATRSTVLTSLVGAPYDTVRFRDPAVRRWRLACARLADAITARWLCDHFHAVSVSARKAAVEALGLAPERVTVIPRGRDPRRLGVRSPERRARGRKALELVEDDLVVVSTGRQEFQKGQIHLVEAMARLAPRQPRLRVLIAGREGRSTPELRALAAPLGDRVRFLGHRTDVPEVLAAADLFVFPSLYEGLPGAVIEAMALGLPVVASDIPPVREVVEPGRSALLVPPGDPGSLAGAIDAMLAERGRAAAFGSRGRAIFEERFTLERSVSGMLDLYRRLVPGAPLPGRSG